jgi:hypothetical protein
MSNFSVLGMSRGLVWLDENLNFLAPFLSAKNMRVKVPRQGMADEDIIDELLSHRIFITNNPKDFWKYISEYEIGLVSTVNLKTKDGKQLSRLISDAFSELNLWSKAKPFYLELDASGKHAFKKVPA